MAKVSIKTEAEYFNHGVKANRSIDIVFKTPYSELVNVIKSLQMLNENVIVGARIGTDKPIRLGSFMVKNLNIDNDGEAKLKLNSQTDFVELGNINELVTRSDEPLTLLLKAEIEEEDNEEDEDEEEDEEDPDGNEVTQDDLPFPEVEI